MATFYKRPSSSGAQQDVEDGQEDLRAAYHKGVEEGRRRSAAIEEEVVNNTPPADAKLKLAWERGREKGLQEGYSLGWQEAVDFYFKDG